VSIEADPKTILPPKLPPGAPAHLPRRVATVARPRNSPNPDLFLPSE
jgi:hypothetical protein